MNTQVSQTKAIEDQLMVVWNHGLLDEAMKSTDQELFDEAFANLSVPGEAKASIQELFFKLVIPGFLSTKAFVKDCVYWSQTDWPTDHEINEIINSAGLFYFWTEHFTPGKPIHILSIATGVTVAFDGLTWKLDPLGDFEIIENRGFGPKKTYFKVSMENRRLSDMIDKVVCNYCKWLTGNHIY